jgi:hypothetical protein
VEPRGHRCIGRCFRRCGRGVLTFGAIVTACFIFGLLARREKKVLGLGPDSLVVLFTYIGGPATHVRAWMMLPPAAQVCPREINKEDSH